MKRSSIIATAAVLAPATILMMNIMISGVMPGWAYRDYFTEEQKEQLSKIKTVAVDAVALTDRGPTDAGPFKEILQRRMAELGYNVVKDTTQPHDVLVRAKCEQRKTWEGTTASGGDYDLPDAPSRLWKGPACQLTYVLGGMKIKWQKEVHTLFQDAVEAAKTANADEPGEYAMAKLKELLDQYDFPVLLAAEWGHDDRLLKVLDTASTNQQKLLVISLLGEMLSDQALPRLKEALKEKDLSKEAAVALGNIGRDGIPVLVEILKTSTQPDLQAAAAKGLGQVGGLHGDASVVPPLLEMLDAPGIDIAVQTEIAWALGKMPDKRSIDPLYALDKKLQKMRTDDPKVKKLKEAVFWAIKQCDTWDQYS